MQLAPASQLLPQAPQCVLVLIGVSQPLAALLSQLPKPAAQLDTVHWPPAQPAVALDREQVRPHMPQAVGVVLRSTSQPLEGLPSQSPKPLLQMASRHWPETHCPAALEN